MMRRLLSKIVTLMVLLFCISTIGYATPITESNQKHSLATLNLNDSFQQESVEQVLGKLISSESGITRNGQEKIIWTFPYSTIITVNNRIVLIATTNKVSVTGTTLVTSDGISVGENGDQLLNIMGMPTVTQKQPFKNTEFTVYHFKNGDDVESFSINPATNSVAVITLLNMDAF